ncbi:MAG: hypothetical protein RLZZ470_477 [Pseudomonadota bacterium]|jgi:hypothetical protein
MSCLKSLALALLLINLGACASHSSKAIGQLDDKSEAFGTGACQNARHNAWIHDEVKTHKLWAAPSVLLFAGPVAVVPLFLTNVGLNTADRLHASDITARCGGTPPTQSAMTESIALDAALDLTVGAVVPVGSTLANVGGR